MSHHFNRGHLALLLTAALFGLAFIFQRHAAQYTDALWFNTWRFLAASVFLALAWALQHKVKPLHDYGRFVFYGAISGIFMFGGIIAQQWGLAHTTAGKSGFLTGLYVVLVPIIAIAFGHKANRAIMVAVLLACVGLVCFAGIAPDDDLLAWNIGDYATLFGTFCWSLQVIWIGIAVRRANVLALSVVQLIMVSLCSFLGLLLTGQGDNFYNIELLNVTKWDIAYTGIGSSALAFFLQAVGQRRVSAAPAAIILSLEAVFALFFGWWLLKEQVTGLMLLGCGFMFAAMLVAQFEPKTLER